MPKQPMMKEQLFVILGALMFLGTSAVTGGISQLSPIGEAQLQGEPQLTAQNTRTP